MWVTGMAGTTRGANTTIPGPITAATTIRPDIGIALAIITGGIIAAITEITMANAVAIAMAGGVAAVMEAAVMGEVAATANTKT